MDGDVGPLIPRPSAHAQELVATSFGGARARSHEDRQHEDRESELASAVLTHFEIPLMQPLRSSLVGAISALTTRISTSNFVPRGMRGVRYSKSKLPEPALSVLSVTLGPGSGVTEPPNGKG